MIAFLLSLFIAFHALPQPQLLDPFLDALRTSEGGRPPDVIPAFPDLFGDETPPIPQTEVW